MLVFVHGARFVVHCARFFQASIRLVSASATCDLRLAVTADSAGGPSKSLSPYSVSSLPCLV